MYKPGFSLWGQQLCDLVKAIVRIVSLIFNATLLGYFLVYHNPEQTGVFWVFYVVTQAVMLEMFWEAQLQVDKRIQPLLG